MYELVVLSLLMRMAINGYQIARIINDIIGPYARISNGRLYPLLAKLQESGLIQASDEPSPGAHGEHNARKYQITEAGRQRFFRLMLDTTSNPGDYQRIFKQKVSVLHFMQPSERLYLIDHYINYCNMHVMHIVSERDDLLINTPVYFQTSKREVLEATVDVMNHSADQWRLELEWAHHLREKELALQDNRREDPSRSDPNK